MVRLCTRRSAGRAAARADAHDAHGTFGFWPAVATTVNYIVGAGFLGIPAVVAKAGLLLSPLVIMVFGVFLDFTKDLLVEVLGRVEAIAKVEAIAHRHVEEGRQGSGGPRAELRLEDALVKPSREEYLVSRHRKFEITDQLYMLIGKKAQLAYVAALCLYMYGSLVGYGTIAAASLTANVPVSFLGGETCDVQKQECGAPYRFWLLLYALLVVPCSALEIREQVIMQGVMFLLRIAIMALLAGTTAAGFGCDGVVFADVAPGTEGTGVPLANAGGLGALIPTAVFAFVFHHSVPALSQPVAAKETLRSVFRTAFLIVGACYVGIGVAVAAFFGSRVDSQCNLNWVGYVGCMPRPAGYSAAAWPGGAGASAPACSSSGAWAPGCVDVSARPAWATAVAYVVLLFPALDVLSAFPLNALTLGNNLMSAALGESALAAPSPTEEADFFASQEEMARAAAAPAWFRWLFVGRPPSPGPSAAPPAAGVGSSAAPPAGSRPGRASSSEAASTPFLAAAAEEEGEGGSNERPLSSALLSPAASPRSSGSLNAGAAAASQALSPTPPDASGSEPPRRIRLKPLGIEGGPAGRAPGSALAAAAQGEFTPLVDASPTVDLILLEAQGAEVATGAGSSGAAAGSGGADAQHTGQTPHRRPDAAAATGPARRLCMRTRRGHRAVTTCFRMLAAVPPVLVAFGVSSLGNVLEFTGLVGVAIAFAVPACLALFAFAKQRALFAAVSAVLLRRRVPAGGEGGTRSCITSVALRGEADLLLAQLPAAAAAVRAVESQLAEATEEAEGAAELVGAGASTGPGAPHPLSLHRVCAHALRSSQVTFAEALTHTSADAAFARTPYTPALKRSRVPEGVLAFSLAIGAFVAVMIVRGYINGS